MPVAQWLAASSGRRTNASIAFARPLDAASRAVEALESAGKPCMRGRTNNAMPNLLFVRSIQTTASVA